LQYGGHFLSVFPQNIKKKVQKQEVSPFLSKISFIHAGLMKFKEK